MWSVVSLIRGNIEQPCRGVIDQPRATPWEPVTHARASPEGAELCYAALSGLALRRANRSQGDALGCYSMPLQGKENVPRIGVSEVLAGEDRQSTSEPLSQLPKLSRTPARTGQRKRATKGRLGSIRPKRHVAFRTPTEGVLACVPAHLREE